MRRAASTLSAAGGKVSSLVQKPQSGRAKRRAGKEGRMHWMAGWLAVQRILGGHAGRGHNAICSAARCTLCVSSSVVFHLGGRVVVLLSTCTVPLGQRHDRLAVAILLFSPHLAQYCAAFLVFNVYCRTLAVRRVVFQNLGRLHRMSPRPRSLSPRASQVEQEEHGGGL